MSKKLGRNQPCWCGSGKKYKKCHLNRENEKPPEMWEVNNQAKKAYAKKFCSCPEELKKECKGNIIHAHTVSKSSSLKKISRKSHVYGLLPDIFKFDKGGGRIEPELIGINKASTFTGFCSEHDKKLFSSFEDREFNLEKEQIFLLSYRSISAEHFKKSAQQENLDILKNGDRGRSKEEQKMLQEFVAAYEYTLGLGVRDSNHHKTEFDQRLVQKNYDDINACVIEFDKVLPIQCSSILFPEIDFSGKDIQSLADFDKTLDLVCFSILSEGDKSYAILSWLKESAESCEKLVDSFTQLSKQDQVSAIFKFALFSFENIYMEPNWWESLSETTKTYILDAQQPLSTVSKNYDDATDIDFFECSVKSISRV